MHGLQQTVRNAQHTLHGYMDMDMDTMFVHVACGENSDISTEQAVGLIGVLVAPLPSLAYDLLCMVARLGPLVHTRLGSLAIKYLCMAV